LKPVFSRRLISMNVAKKCETHKINPWENFENQGKNNQKLETFHENIRFRLLKQLIKFKLHFIRFQPFQPRCSHKKICTLNKKRWNSRLPTSPCFLCEDYFHFGHRFELQGLLLFSMNK